MVYGGLAELELASGMQKDGECDQEWYPCTCTYIDPASESSRISIGCYEAPILEVAELFKRVNAAKLRGIQLVDFTYDEVGIPDSLLGNSLVESGIKLKCPNDLNIPLKISENAFYPAKKLI